MPAVSAIIVHLRSSPAMKAENCSGDSIVGEYAIHCDEVVECRTLRQLEQFVGELA